MSQTIRTSLKAWALKVITPTDDHPISQSYYAAFDTPQEAWAAVAMRFLARRTKWPFLVRQETHNQIGHALIQHLLIPYWTC